MSAKREFTCWHDDGRGVIVEAKDDREATDLALDFFHETDINMISVDDEDEHA